MQLGKGDDQANRPAYLPMKDQEPEVANVRPEYGQNHVSELDVP